MTTPWTRESARAIYRVQHWGAGYFDVGEDGHVIARPAGETARGAIDLRQLAQEIQAGGQSLPVLVRFLDILHHRIDTLYDAFASAISDDSYEGRYLPVYPIKVNQQRSVVREIMQHGAGRVGLEAGSKPELLAVLGLGPTDGGVIVCNGYKDREYVRLALIGQRLGQRAYIVIEKASELQLILEESAKLGIKPLLGMRIRLASVGAGNWQNSGGEKSKFGLSPVRALQVLEQLRTAGALDSLQLLHVHLGSQIANIRDIQNAMREVGRYYVELRRLGVDLKVVDVGGGLGVDYEGMRSRSYCSMNYSVREYANCVVHSLWEICSQLGLPHPDIVTEAGRAMTAHHAVLLTNVTDIDAAPDPQELAPPAADAPMILHDFWQGWTHLDKRSAIEAYHDAVHWLSEAQQMYTHGLLSLEQRAWAEEVYFALCRDVRPFLQPSSPSHREIFDELAEKFADKVFCNFSVFQSIPDVWAIDQIFPIMPIHRLDEEPTRRGLLKDLTCDSDGCVQLYVQGDGIERTLPLHSPVPGEPYLIAIFLVGAYQEILGDLHNLFGDVASINVQLEGDSHRLSEPRQGDTVGEVLRLVDIRGEDLLQAYRRRIDAAPDLTPDTRRLYLAELQAGLMGTTYLED